ncbi:unnamed protein product [Eretmochelys imbricata]
MIFLFSSWDRIKVNGKDISSFALQEALEILQSTDDQITLEVQREKSSHKPPQTSDAATQTDSSWWDEQCPHREDFTPSGFNLFLGRYVHGFAWGSSTKQRWDNYPPLTSGPALNSFAIDI